MGFYIGADGQYYIGQPKRSQDLQVQPRPTQFHVWDGEKWIEDLDAKNAVDLEQMIRDEIRTLAIDSLKAKGKI